MEINIILVLVKLRDSQDGNTTFPPILLFHLNKTGTQAEARILFYIINCWDGLGVGRIFITFIQPHFSFWESPFVSPEVQLFQQKPFVKTEKFASDSMSSFQASIGLI
jgi:hypothetical protein